jgi:hypothetical protein
MGGMASASLLSSSSDVGSAQEAGMNTMDDMRPALP